MKHTLFYIILFLNISICYSQNEYNKSVDSLYVLIAKEKNSDSKINYYNSLCNIYSEYNLDELKKCNEALLIEAKKNNSKQGLGFYYCNQGKLFSHSDFKVAIENTIKGLKLLKSISDWDNYFYNCWLLGTFYNYNDEIDKGIFFLNQNLELAKKMHHKNETYLLFGLSILHRSKNDFSKAIYYAKESLNSNIPLKEKSTIYHGIANIYLKTGRFEKALEYNNLDLQYAQTLESTNSALYRRGHILIKLNRSKEAVVALKQCLQYYKSQKSSVEIIDSYCSLSMAYFDLNEYQKANYYLDEIVRLHLCPDINENDYLFCTLKANIYVALKDEPNAEKNIRIALKLLNENISNFQKEFLFQAIVKLKKRQNDFKTALIYEEKILEITKSEIKINTTSQLHQLEVDLDVTEKNNRIKNLQIAKLQKQVELNAKNSYLVYSGIGILILGLLVFYFMYNQNIIRIKNRLIVIANTKLGNEKDKTQKSLSEKETLLKEIHHRVKNNMQLVISLLKIQARDTKQLSTENFIEISEKRIRAMALIHEYLYESENINYVNFEEYINRLSRSLLSSFSGQSDIKIETEIENVHFDIETSIPLGLIINELVINAFKHAFVGKAAGVIKIKLFEKDCLHHLVVADNGVGLVENAQKGTSIGLKIVDLLVFQIGGVMDIKNESGTSVIIQFTNYTNKNEQ